MNKLLLLAIVILFAYAYLFPFKRMNRNSRVCHSSALFRNQTLCTFAGCTWGSGDLMGPPFCGAYK